jgi:diguanylate cyclase (GGDEF)-like protein/PAS domain S-box-containing protein
MKLNRFQWRSLNTRITLVTLAIFLVSIWSLALYAVSALRADMQRILGQQQISTVTMVAAEIDAKLALRFDALQRIANLIDTPLLEQPAALQKLLEERLLLKVMFNAGAFVTRLDGHAIAAVPRSSGRLGVNYLDTDNIAAALREGKSSIGRPSLGAESKNPVLSVAVPIRDARGRVIGALAGVIDLALPNFLEQITQARYGKTGGYYLVAPQYRLIVTATDRSRVMETYAPAGVNPAVDRVTDGFEGSLVYVNLPGVEILASAKRIPVVGWVMVAMLPTAEAFAPVRAMQQRMVLATLLLSLLAGFLIWWMVRQQLGPLQASAKALTALPTANQPLPVLRHDEIGQLIGGFNGLLEVLTLREAALKDSESFKNSILNSVAAEIVVLDRKGLIRAVNERWRRFALENAGDAGTPAPRTEVGADYLAICEADTEPSSHSGLEASRGIRAVLDGNLDSFSLEYPCDSPREQRWFSMIALPLGPAASDGVVITHAEVTALKLAQQALAESKELLTLFIQYAPAGLAMFDRQMRYLYASSHWLAEYGLGQRELQGLSHYEVFPEISEEWKQAHRRGLEGEVLRSEGDRFERLDGSVQWVKWEIRPWYDAQRAIGGIVIFTEDITAGKKAEEALRASEERMSLMLRGTRDGFWDWDLARDRIYYSPRWWNMFGYADGELGAAPDLWRSLTHPDDLDRVSQVFGAALADYSEAYDVEFRMRHKDGHYLDILSRAFILRDDQGKAIRVSGSNMDLTERKQMEEALREQEAFFRLIAENLEGFVVVLDTEGRRLYNSPSYERLLHGRKLAGSSSFADVHPDDRERVISAFRETVASGQGQHLEYQFVMADGGVCMLESRSGVIKDSQGRTKRVVVVSHDVTERRRVEAKIHHLAFHDTLTQLPNRLTLSDRLRQTMASSKRSDSYAALIFLDLDNFKPLNDTHGHEAGDLLLIEVANRLKTCVREMDTVARFGGDEFVVLLGALDADKAESMSQARRVAEKIRLILAEPYLLTIRQEAKADQTVEHQCTASIGVTLFLDHEASEDEILNCADAAMYRAKEAGRNLIRFYDSKA